MVPALLLLLHAVTSGLTKLASQALVRTTPSAHLLESVLLIVPLSLLSSLFLPQRRQATALSSPRRSSRTR